MSSREQILQAIKKNQPELSELPNSKVSATTYADVEEKFTSTVCNIGGTVIRATQWDEISSSLAKNFVGTKRIANTITDLSSLSAPSAFSNDPHQLENVELAVIQGEFGVAENGAIWITDSRMGDRALPFICQHLALVINKTDLVHTLHEAYERIGSSGYDLGTFIAGPSKTADIEQSLVLGAHGAKSFIVFILG